MQPKPQRTLEQALDLDYTKGKEDIWLTSQHTLRRLIGILGILLPLLLFSILYIDAGYKSPLYSVSHYYFTRASSVFSIVVSLLAVFLLIYKGKAPVDFYVSSVAGLFALCVILFPTNNISGICQDKEHLYSVTILKDSRMRSVFHYISAAIFLSCLAYLAIFLFTKSDSSPATRGKPKRRRNRVFRTCGVIMVLAILVVLSNPLGLISDEAFSKYHIVFWMEIIAVESFGIAWLVKGQLILKDSESPKT